MLKKIKIHTPKHFLHTKKGCGNPDNKKDNSTKLKYYKLTLFFKIAVQHHSLLKKGASQIGISSGRRQCPFIETGFKQT